VHGCDAVVFSAGAGGKGGDEATTRVDGDGPGKLAAAAKRAGVGRCMNGSLDDDKAPTRPNHAGTKRTQRRSSRGERP
jgi:hypothetical protein